MKTLDEYLKLPYPMEIVEDQEEGDTLYLFRICQAVLPVGKP